MNQVIVILFMVELVMKWFAFGCRDFFCGKERLWNVFDFVPWICVLDLFIRGDRGFILLGNSDGVHHRGILRCWRDEQ